MFAPHGSCSDGESGPAPRAVSVRGVVKEFAGDGVPAVDDVSFDVEDGELLVLLGPSGCGKTTTLRMIAGLEEPDAGEIWLGARLVARPSAACSCRPRSATSAWSSRATRSGRT